MSVENQGSCLKLAREAVNLTQEQLSDGVCDVFTLAKIENGIYGASPALFRALMSKLGMCTDVFPLFKSKEDFDCYRSLKNVHHYINSLNIEKAYCELKYVEKNNLASNHLYYQEWLWLYCEILRYTDYSCHKDIIQIVEHGLRLTNSDIDIDYFTNRVLTINEIGLLIELAYQLCESSQLEKSKSVTALLKKYLSNKKIIFLEKKHFFSEVEMLTALQLQSEGKNEVARHVIEEEYKNALANADDRALVELTLLDAYSLFCQNKRREYEEKIRTAIYSVQATQSGFDAFVCKWLLKKQCFILDDFLECKSTREFELPNIKNQMNTKTASLILEEEYYSIGRIIHDLRKTQKITLDNLCSGLCTKSCLSKIENNQQSPNLFLAEALLQRLGLSTEEFIFFGNKHETELYELRKELIIAHRTDEVYEMELTTKLERIIRKNDKLMMQYFLYKRAYKQEDIDKRIRDLYGALSLTVKNFDIDTISQTHLTWMEMTIINNIALSRIKKNPTLESIEFLNKYRVFLTSKTQLSEILKCRIYPITITELVARLYVKNEYDIIIKLFSNGNSYAFNTKLIMVSTFLANVCRAYAKMGDWANAKKYGLQSYYSFLLYRNKDAQLIKVFFEKSGYRIIDLIL